MAARQRHAARWMPTADDEQALKALEQYGDPTVEEVQMPSRPSPPPWPAGWCITSSCGSGRSARRSPRTLSCSSPSSSGTPCATPAPASSACACGAASRIRVEVRDPSRGLPCLMPVRETDISGRGLFLVDKLSDRWGVDLLPRGKNTWFEMRVADRGIVQSHRTAHQAPLPHPPGPSSRIRWRPASGGAPRAPRTPSTAPLRPVRRPPAGRPRRCAGRTEAPCMPW